MHLNTGLINRLILFFFVKDSGVDANAVAERVMSVFCSYYVRRLSANNMSDSGSCWYFAFFATKTAHKLNIAETSMYQFSYAIRL